MNIDARALDYKDGLNPFLLNQFDPERRPSDFATLQTDLYVALRLATGYELRLEVVPDGQNLTLAARGSYESRFFIPHGSFLYAITAASPAAAGFSFQVSDLGRGGTLFATPLKHDVASGGTGNVDGVENMLFLLQKPRAVLSPGLMAVRVTNRAATTNALQLVLWFMQPSQDPGPRPAPNRFDQYLQEEIARQGQIRRWNYTGPEGTGASIGIEYNGQPYPWEQMPPGGTPLLYERVITVPAAATADAPVIEFVVPPGFTCALKRHSHRYLGPGFVEGSGDLIWRIEVDGAHAPGYDDMRTTADREIHGAILAEQNQTVRYTVSVDAAAILGDELLCGLQGYFYPQQ